MDEEYPPPYGGIVGARSGQMTTLQNQNLNTQDFKIYPIGAAELYPII